MKLNDMLVTDAELSELAGVSARRIRQLTETGRLTKADRNRYQLSEVFMALVEEMAGGDKAAELTAERVRKLKADATRAELLVAKECGEVAPLDQVTEMVSLAFANVRANMLSLPGRVVSQLIGEHDERRFKRVLTDEIKIILTNLATSDLTRKDAEE